MGILDDAIREHLDLKRQHGARDAELREIEDEAFGSGDQPDAFVAGELYTEVGSAESTEAGNEEPTRLVEAEGLRPAEPAREPEPETSDQSIAAEPASRIPGQVELPGQDEIPGQERLEEPESYQPSTEPEIGPSTEEPGSYLPAEDISEQAPEPPSPSESLEELIAEEEPFPEDSGAPPPLPAPPETEREPESRPLEPEPDAQAPPEPEGAVPDPPPPPPEPGIEPPGRARGRVDVPTQEHPPPVDTGDLPPLPGDELELGRPDTSYEPPPPMEEPSSTEHPILEEEPSSTEYPISDELAAADEGASPAEDGPQLYDFETDEESVSQPSGGSAVDDDFEALGPAEEEAPYLDEEEPYAEEPPEDQSFDTEVRSKEEEEGEEEGLWFEKGPPKDFDFDD